MKKSFVLIFVLICAALSVLSVSAAPRDRYYDQLGNKHWCNSDSYGCWVTGENGEHEYIMFWSESARDAIMGPDSKAPIGTNPGTSELTLAAPNQKTGDVCSVEACEANKSGVPCDNPGETWHCIVKWPNDPFPDCCYCMCY